MAPLCLILNSASAYTHVHTQKPYFLQTQGNVETVVCLLHVSKRTWTQIKNASNTQLDLRVTKTNPTRKIGSNFILALNEPEQLLVIWVAH